MPATPSQRATEVESASSAPSLLADRLQALARVRRPRWSPELAPLAGIPVDLPAFARVHDRRGLFAAPGGSAGLAREPAKLPRREPVLALVQRITQGFELGEYERARALGYEAYLEEQLDPDALDDSALAARLARFATLDLSPKQLFDGYRDDLATPILELKGSLIVRALYSRRQLHERMCEFLRDHFHIDHQKGDAMWALKPEDERTVIRPHALGKFPDMLRASAASPAMLFYLDNWLNLRGAPQENYARELLELHTLGLNGGYTEADVKEVAKCFTGWTLNVDEGSPDFLRTTFVAALHEPGPKRVLGSVIPGLPARENVQRVLDLLAMHPSTARFLARKLARWLLTPAPSEELVTRVANAYLTSGGDVRAMLRVLLARENLAGVAAPLAPKFRRPFHLVTSALRALEADVSDPLYPLLLLYLMGQPPLDRAAPDGYPDTVAAWGRSLLPRWHALSLLVAGGNIPFLGGGGLPGVNLDRARLCARLGLGRRIEAAGLAAKIDERLLGGALSEPERASLQAFLDERAPLLDADLFEGIALAMSMPGYQWY